MDDVAIDDLAEGIVRSLAVRLTHPRAGECLLCFVARMLEDFGCDDTLRFARGYRDLRAPRASALEDRLGRMGGFCDCEIFLNAMTLAPQLRRYDAYGDELEAAPRSCRGVRRGSTQGCANWVRRPRGLYG